jgi:hypothetical protein
LQRFWQKVRSGEHPSTGPSLGGASGTTSSSASAASGGEPSSPPVVVSAISPSPIDASASLPVMPSAPPSAFIEPSGKGASICAPSAGKGVPSSMPRTHPHPAEADAAAATAIADVKRAKGKRFPRLIP